MVDTMKKSYRKRYRKWGGDDRYFILQNNCLGRHSGYTADRRANNGQLRSASMYEWLTTPLIVAENLCAVFQSHKIGAHSKVASKITCAEILSHLGGGCVGPLKGSV